MAARGRTGAGGAVYGLGRIHASLGWWCPWVLYPGRVNGVRNGRIERRRTVRGWRGVSTPGQFPKKRAKGVKVWTR